MMMGCMMCLRMSWDLLHDEFAIVVGLIALYVCECRGTYYMMCSSVQELFLNNYDVIYCIICLNFSLTIYLKNEKR